MTFALRVKRAMIDNLDGFNEQPDANWGPAETNAYYYFCSKFGGSFSNYPSRADQSEDFLKFVDNYEDEDYTNTDKPEPVVQKSGVDLKSLMPDRQPIPEGTPEQKRIINALVNGNVGVKPPPQPIKTEEAKEKQDEPDKASTDKDETKEDNANKPDTESKNSDSNTRSTESSKPANTQGAAKPTASEAPKAKPPAGNVPGVGKIRVR